MSLLQRYAFPLVHHEIPLKYLPRFRLPLIDRPTVVEEFPFFSNQSRKVFLKRDDQLDFYASGNKLRKLEFLFGNILSRPQCEHVITAGSLHSNHCKAVALLSARYHRQSHLLLRTDRSIDDDKIFSGNVLLNSLFGAKLYFISKKAKIKDEIEPRMNELTEELGGPDRCYSIPIGGSDNVGFFGYFDCFIREILPLIDELDLGHLVVPVSSGGTMEGLALANHFTGNRLRLHAFAVSDNENYFKTHFREVLQRFELDHLIERIDNDELVDICDKHVGLGYGRMSDEQMEFLHRISRQSGIIFDPVYTGKCLWALNEELRGRRFSEGKKNLLVLHTGGFLGLMNPDYSEQWLKTSAKLQNLSQL